MLMACQTYEIMRWKKYEPATSWNFVWQLIHTEIIKFLLLLLLSVKL